MSVEDFDPFQLEMRPASGDDLAFLYDLVRATMRIYVEATWGEWDEAWQCNRFTERFDHTKWAILLVNGEPVGGVAIEPRPNEMYLRNLHVLPEYQGLGIGTAVVQSLLDIAAERGQPLTLNVIRSNSGARRFYERLGFRVVEEDDHRFWMTSETPQEQSGDKNAQTRHDQSRRLVERGYDAIAEQYLASKDENDPHLLKMLESLANRLPPNASLLDLGCGAGVPAMRWLVRQGFTVTGVDVSARQLELARQHVPNAAALVQADMAMEVEEGGLDCPSESFDAVIALYSIIHVPRERQFALLTRIRRWLRPNGLFLATWAVGAWEGEDKDWEGWGVPMWWSHFDATTNLQMLHDAGFTVMEQQTVTSGGETWLWGLAIAIER